MDDEISEMLERIGAKMPPIVLDHEWMNELISSFLAQMPIVSILVILMFLDVVTGYLAAGISKEIDSTISYRGAMKKAQMLLAIAAGTVFERIQPGMPWGKLIASLAAIGEMWSILENMAKSGIPMPQALKEMLIRQRSASRESSEARAHADVTLIVQEGDSKVTKEKQKSTDEKLEILLPGGGTPEEHARAKERVAKRTRELEQRKSNDSSSDC